MDRGSADDTASLHHPTATRRPPQKQSNDMRQNSRREKVDAFVQRHFTWPGTLRLHSAALGLDILRAPVNVVLSPILVLARIAAWICRKLRLARVAEAVHRRRHTGASATQAKPGVEHCVSSVGVLRMQIWQASVHSRQVASCAPKAATWGVSSAGRAGALASSAKAGHAKIRSRARRVFRF